jgi:hypothetical protein
MNYSPGWGSNIVSKTTNRDRMTRVFRFLPDAEKVNQEISTVLPVQKLQ